MQDGAAALRRSCHFVMQGFLPASTVFHAECGVSRRTSPKGVIDYGLPGICLGIDSSARLQGATGWRMRKFVKALVAPNGTTTPTQNLLGPVAVENCQSDGPVHMYTHQHQLGPKSISLPPGTL